MIISDKKIEGWAGEMEAHTILPELVRRLIHCTIPASKISESSVPSDIFRKGWDGKLKCSQGNAWVPCGASFWEFSSKLDILGKFKEDYNKRSKQYFDNPHMGSFVFVTPRKITHDEKEGLIELTTKDSSPWTEVRIFHSADLAEWLETPNALSVQTWFAGKIGIPISSLVDVGRSWDRWANASKPAISPKLILADRDRQVKILQKFLKAPPSGIVEVYADSREESAAFIAAATLEEKTSSLADRIIVVEENPERIEEWTAHAGEIFPIFLLNHENMVEKVKHLGDEVHILVAMPKGGRRQNNYSERQVLLPRISVSSFEKELVNMKIHVLEAQQKAHQCSSSVTVFCRHYSKVNYVKYPEWAQDNNVNVMVAAALAGAWDYENSNDRDFMCSLAGNDSYEDFDSKITAFTQMDNVPIEFERRIWKMKSHFDALKCVFNKIGPYALDRFLQKIEGIFAPDVEAVSGTLSSKVVDTLAILSSFYINNPCESGKIDRCVAVVLNRTFDKSRNLTSLAEASPRVFLDMVEERADSEERIPRNAVLPALATLAWDGEHFPRIVEILIKVIEKEGAGHDLLFSFFCPWLPCCGATKAERKEQIKYIESKNRNIIFDICIDMLNRDIGVSLHIPMWRVPYGNFENFNILRSETIEMRKYAFLTAIKLHDNCVKSIKKLLQSISLLNRDNVAKLTDAVHMWHGQSPPPSPGDVAKIRKVAGDLLCRCEQHILSEGALEYRTFVQEKLNHLYDTLVPINVVQEYLWLFSSNWPTLPDESTMSTEQKQATLKERRCSAIKEILTRENDDGIWEICKLGGNPFCVGESLPEDWTTEKRLDYMHKFTSQCSGFEMQIPFISGMLFSTPGFSPTLAVEILTSKRHEKWKHNTTLSFLLAAHPSRDMWNAMESFAPTVTSEYWKKMNIHSVRNSADLIFLAEKLLLHERPSDAIERAFWGEFPDMSGSFVARLLRVAINKKDALSDKAHVIEGALSFLTASKEVDIFEIRELEIDSYQFLSGARLKETFKGMAKYPDFFVDTVDKASNEPLSEGLREWRYKLEQWDVPPGLNEDGCFSDELFNQWIEKVMKKAQKLSLLKEVHEYIGRVLVYLPRGDDLPLFNCRAAREFLNGENAQKIRDGYYSGIFRSRGIRGFSGNIGEKYRADAKKHREISQQIDEEGYSHIAAVHEGVAEEYERRAKQEDRR